MKFKNFIKESLRDDELNRILDKMNDNSPLTNSEREFLSKYKSTNDDDYKDKRYLTNIDVFQTISRLIDNDRKIVCNLFNSNNDGIDIIGIDISSDDYKLLLKNKKTISLKDKYLYNIIYNFIKDEYSLEIQDEYYEKVPIKNEN